MMKSIYRLLLPSLLLSTIVSTQALADDPTDQTGQQISQNTQNLATYLLNLGSYLGYNIASKPPLPDGTAPSQGLLNVNSITVPEISFYDTFLGALTVNAQSAQLMQFVPTSANSSVSTLNPLANTTFTDYNSPSSQAGTLNASLLIDQKTYQNDPVSQAVLNILGTPDATYCMNNDATAWTDNCSLLYDNLVTTNVIGKLPGTSQYFTYDYNQQFLSQLNINTLLSPLLYSSSTGGSSTSSSPQPTTLAGAGLTALSQAQQAANFIRYASGAVLPVSLPRLKDYDTLYAKAANVAKNVSQNDQMKAQATLSTYLANVRVYAAQSSVGFSNLYYILSKRIPQTLPGPSGQPNIVTSQALSEFNMATWRLFNPDTNAQAWVTGINTASPATVQKEMVTLLAEINYQLYLNRQQEERMLLTETMLLIQNSHTGQPNASSLTTDNSP